MLETTPKIAKYIRSYQKVKQFV